MKFRVGIQWEIVCFMGRGDSSALVSNPHCDVSREKHWWFCNLRFSRPIISEILNHNSEDNCVSRTGPVKEGSSHGRCSLVRQQGPGRHPATVRTKWSKTVNMTVFECFFRSKPFDDEGPQLKVTGNE